MVGASSVTLPFCFFFFIISDTFTTKANYIISRKEHNTIILLVIGKQW